MSTYEVNFGQLRTLNCPPLPDAPAEVRDALQHQDDAITELIDHTDATEHIICDDWEQRAEVAMLVHARLGEPYENLVNERRVQRVAAITRTRELEAAVRKAAREVRAAVHTWARSDQHEVQRAEHTARQAELDAVEKLNKARRTWLDAAGVAQWIAAAAAAAQPAGVRDWRGGATSAAGEIIDVAELGRIREHVEQEHQRADNGTKAFAEHAASLITGPSGVTFSVPIGTADQLIRGDDDIRRADPQPAA